VVGGCVQAKLAELAPDGVDCYFDNTAGPVLEEVLLACNNNGRIALCGLINQYNIDKVGVKNYDMILMRRLLVQGFICIDQGEHMPAMLEMVGAGIKEGKIKYKLDVQKGLERYIDVVNMLYTGANSGKLILEL
jgi:NADPH-dependent curcumin reductase CurA